MKNISIIGIGISILSSLFGLYTQIAIFPKATTDGFSSLSAFSTMRSYGYIELLLGIIALALCIFPAIKIKSKIAFIGISLSLLGIILGLTHSTHIFI